MAVSSTNGFTCSRESFTSQLLAVVKLPLCPVFHPNPAEIGCAATSLPPSSPRIAPAMPIAAHPTGGSNAKGFTKPTG